MEFIKPPKDRRTKQLTGQVAPAVVSHRTKPAKTASMSSITPTVSGAFKFSAKIIKAALAHAARSVAHETKELIKITEEEFDLDNNPRWQKIRLIIIKIARKLKLPPKIFLTIVGVVIVVLIALVVSQTLAKPRSATPNGDKKSTNYTSTKLEKGTPNYPTLLPTGKTIKDLGGWTRVSPTTASPVYAFADKVENVGLIISEQPVPDALKKSDGVEAFAKSFSADQKITVGSTTVYIGTSSKGPQSAVLVKSNVLILIKTDSKLTDAQWADYIGSLN